MVDRRDERHIHADCSSLEDKDKDEDGTRRALASLGDDALPLCKFLEELGARNHRHTTHSLYDHLIRTAAILKRWGARDDLWKAGLFHSCYGTESFTEALLPFDDRQRVIDLLGVDSERIAHLFCGLDRRSVYRAVERGEPFVVERSKPRVSVDVSAAELTDVVWMVWANALEHVPQVAMTEQARRGARAGIAKIAHLLPEVARAELGVTYAEQPNASTTPLPTVTRLLNLEDKKAFTESHFPDKRFVGRGPVERLAGLVDYDFDALVRMKRGGTRAFFRSLDGTYENIPVSPGQEHALYSAGFTIYFHGLQHPQLDAWISAISNELSLLRSGTRVSAFASRKGAGVINHYDLNDNFVCQARGTKRWRVAYNTHCDKPTIGYRTGQKISDAHRVEAPNGFPDAMPDPNEVIDLTPGTVMFMPRGMWHQTETVADASLHFNIQCGFATWRDALSFVLKDNPALHADEFREAIRGELDAIDPATFRAELEAKLRRAVDIIVERELTVDMGGLERAVAERLGRP